MLLAVLSAPYPAKLSAVEVGIGVGVGGGVVVGGTVVGGTVVGGTVVGGGVVGGGVDGPNADVLSRMTLPVPAGDAEPAAAEATEGTMTAAAAATTDAAIPRRVA